jgi:hypothetical protein
MSKRLLSRRRPSAAMAVSVLALFVALGGVGYAASFLPANSVGNRQIQNAAVSYWKILNGSVGNWKLAFGAVGARKIANGAVGKSQINTSQVQARVSGTCTAGQGAVTAVSSAGAVTCGSTPPRQFGTRADQAPLGSTPVASKSLPAGSSYLVFGVANATVTSTTANQWVKVSCTLNPGSGDSQTSTSTVHAIDNPESVTIPIVALASSSTTAINATLSCSSEHSTGASPTITAGGTINAVQTAGNS